MSTEILREEFANESNRALEIALTRPRRWEYLLTAELIKSKTTQIRIRLNSVQEGSAHKPSTYPDWVTYFDWIKATIQSVKFQITQVSGVRTQELHLAWGPPGQPGDPIRIKQAIDGIFHCYDELVILLTAVDSISSPDVFANLNRLIRAFVSDVLLSFIAATEHLAEELERPGQGSRTIALEVRVQNTMVQEFQAEINAIIQTYSESVVSSTDNIGSPQQRGMRFEDLCLRLVRQMGFDAQTTKPTSDGGIDIIAVSKRPLISGKYVIQCKAWKHSVGEPVVRELFGVVHAERANKGILIATSTFTSSAWAFAKDKPLELIDGEGLQALLKQYLIGDLPSEAADRKSVP